MVPSSMKLQSMLEQHIWKEKDTRQDKEYMKPGCYDDKTAVHAQKQFNKWVFFFTFCNYPRKPAF